MVWIRAHWKGIIAIVTAVLALGVIDDETAKTVVSIIGVIGVILFPNDQAAIEQIYGPRKGR